MKKKPGPVPVAQNRLDALDAISPLSERVANGEGYRAIAADAGVGLGRLAHWIEADPERSRAFTRARELSAVAFDEKAQKGIEDAADPFEFMKAKELAVHYRWRSRVADPKRYGDKQDINLSGKVEMASAIVAARKRSGGS